MRVLDYIPAIFVFLASSSLLMLLYGLYSKDHSISNRNKQVTALLTIAILVTACWMAFLAISPLNGNTLASLLAFLTLLPTVQLAGNWHKRKAIKTCIRKDLPILLDSMVLSVEAGQSLLPAFYSAQKALPEKSHIKESIASLKTDLELGLSQKDAIEKMRSGLNDQQFSLFVDAVTQSLKLGTPIAKILHEQSERNREFLLMEGEKYANTLSIKLLVPLLMFIFPAAFLVILSPIIVFLIEQSPW